MSTAISRNQIRTFTIRDAIHKTLRVSLSFFFSLHTCSYLASRNFAIYDPAQRWRNKSADVICAVVVSFGNTFICWKDTKSRSTLISSISVFPSSRPSPSSYLTNEFALSSSLDHLQRPPDDLRFVISTRWHQILIVGLETFKVNNYIKI